MTEFDGDGPFKGYVRAKVTKEKPVTFNVVNLHNGGRMTVLNFAAYVVDKHDETLYQVTVWNAPDGAEKHIFDGAVYFIDGKKQVNTFTKSDGSTVISHVLIPRSIALDVVQPRVKWKVKKKVGEPLEN